MPGWQPPARRIVKSRIGG